MIAPWRRVAVLLVLMAAACAHRVTVATLPYTAIPSSVRTGPTKSYPGTERTAATFFGQPILDTVALPAGTRELRISGAWPMAIGETVPILRIIETPQGVTGELWRIWYGMNYGDPKPGERCAGKFPNEYFCGTAAITAPADWRVIADSLAALGAWSMATPCEPGTRFLLAFDSGELYLVRLQAADFGMYECNAPLLRTSSDAGKRAAQLTTYFDRLVEQLTPPRTPRR